MQVIIKLIIEIIRDETKKKLVIYLIIAFFK